MHTNSSDIPLSFAQLALEEALQAAIAKLGFTQPTPVQQQAIPPALAGKDLLVSAETGSGKTAAFLLPTFQNLLNKPTSLFGTRALILTPTRELASQIFQQCLQLAEFTDIKIGLITGGEDFKQQQGVLRRNADIIIATPGRLLEQIKQHSSDFTHLEVLVLDEADRMLDMGFSDDVLNIAGRCNPERQTLLFSATLTHYGVIKIADKVLKQHQVIALNTLHDGHSNIEQQIVLADDNDHKQRLLAWLLLNDSYDKALVFTNTRNKAIELESPLRNQNLRIGVLHGEMEHYERKRIMNLFREGIITILVSTDLAARGLDVKGINLVVNFDVPRNGIDYIHRIGRTGRADEQGVAIALVKSTEWNLMSGIQRFLKQAFIRRTIKELAGSYQGPKKIKSSGKAAGAKKKKEEDKKKPAEKIKIRHRDQKNIGKRRVPSAKPDTEAG
ncbi:MAG: DEAD/DEAH box helicase [Methylovulum sp.]|uniref:DEAD/DEAH box helicase n=1 Tax=Methylovulum sp. TaxID=1916980 RepID=UPI00262746BC|nr:DEAD/DEAH box helicase [Methylovulum sp.]MDD2724455.1 DEAD/DEAH box helicase [Methylovulum sp.]MDD5123666.1 DEAD/DEAH box helicase [Methylovulum sp.]